MFRGLGDNPAAVVKAFAAGAAGDLVEIAGGEDAGFAAVEFAEAGEEDGANGHVDAGAQGVGAADDFEEAALGQLFDEDAVFGEDAGVMEADAVLEPAADVGAVRAGELEAFQRVGEGGFFLARADVDAREILGALGGFELGEVDDIDGAFALGREAFEGLGEGDFGVGEFERHGAILGSDGDGWTAIATGSGLPRKRRCHRAWRT